MQSWQRLPALGEGRFLTNTWLLHFFFLTIFLQTDLLKAHLKWLIFFSFTLWDVLPAFIYLQSLIKRSQNNKIITAGTTLFFFKRSHSFDVSQRAFSFLVQRALIAHRFGKYRWWHLQQQQYDERQFPVCQVGLKVSVLIVQRHLSSGREDGISCSELSTY